MTSPADADAPHPAQREADSGWGAKIALGVVGFFMVVEFVLPGFVAAEFSKSGTGFVGINGIAWTSWRNYAAWPPPAIRAEIVVLTVPDWLMSHSRIIRRFYMWEFRLAGGENLDFFD